MKKITKYKDDSGRNIKEGDCLEWHQTKYRTKTILRVSYNTNSGKFNAVPLTRGGAGYELSDWLEPKSGYVMKNHPIYKDDTLFIVP